ncbi:MAG: hypothetical protein R2779_02960 [Crocinitomicaceae bacterium]
MPGTAGALKVAQKYLQLLKFQLVSIQALKTGDIFGLATIHGASTSGYSYSFITEYF